MASLKDIHETLLSYFGAQLTGLSAYKSGGGSKTVSVRVKLAFRDERFEDEAERVFPEATLALYDATVDNRRRFGGFLETGEKDLGAGTVTVTPNPIPVNLYFQLDAYCLERGEDWAVTEKLLALIGSRTAVALPDGKPMLIVGQSNFARDDFPDPSLIVKSYRFYAPVWFAHPAGSRVEHLITELQLTMHEQRITITEAA